MDSALSFDIIYYYLSLLTLRSSLKLLTAAHENTGERSTQYAAESSCRARYGPYTEWMASFDTGMLLKNIFQKFMLTKLKVDPPYAIIRR